jgi:copper chaperone
MSRILLKGENRMARVKIKGMSCNHCVMAVTQALEEIEGIKDVKVDLSSGEATYDEDKAVDENLVKEKIRQAGYEVI